MTCCFNFVHFKPTYIDILCVTVFCVCFGLGGGQFLGMYVCLFAANQIKRFAALFLGLRPFFLVYYSDNYYKPSILEVNEDATLL